jgi:CBS domain-containing protein
VLDANGVLVGVVTQRQILDAGDGQGTIRDLLRMDPVVVREHETLRDAADLMAVANVGRLPVVSQDASKLIGILTRSDLVSVHRKRLAGHVRDDEAQD